jgi:hypothetical protein
MGRKGTGLNPWFVGHGSGSAGRRHLPDSLGALRPGNKGGVMKKLRISHILSFCLLFIFIIPFLASAATVNLAWDPCNEEDLAGYKVYYGYDTRDYNNSINVGKTTTFQVTGLEYDQTYYFAVTAYNTSLESDYSNEIGYTIPKSDSDGDGLTDEDEINIYGTDPNNPDTDSDDINDGDELAFWGSDWDMDYDNDGIVNLLDPDSDNDSFLDGLEISSGFDPSVPNSEPELFCMEIGEVSLDHNWKRVEFGKSFIEPVVVAKPLSYNGGDPAVLRIRNVDTTGFDIRIQEWNYLDGWHTTETVSYIIMEQGSYTLEDGTKIEAARFDTNKTGSFGWVDFSQAFNQVPVVVSAVLSFNGEDAVCCRLRNIDNTGFDFCMQEQELNSQSHATETISYIAWEPSSGILNDDYLVFEINRTQDAIKHNFETISFNEVFMDIPEFIADMQTADGMDTANLRYRNKDIYGVEVQIDEERSRNRETQHTTEVVGYMVFAAY